MQALFIRDAEQDSHTEQDSNDFYYGMSQRRAQPVRYERDSPVGDSSQQSSGSTRNTFQFDRDAADALPAVKAPVKPLHAQEAETTVRHPHHSCHLFTPKSCAGGINPTSRGGCELWRPITVMALAVELVITSVT